jgi:hypothetical protein
MDDLYLLHADKACLEQCLKEITEVCNALGIVVNTQKTKIVKLSDGVEFLKGKYILLKTGKILRLPCKDSTRRTRRKLKKFKSLIDTKQMSFDDLRRAYQSWRGNYIRRFNAYYRVHYMDKLYQDLFIKNKNPRRLRRGIEDFSLKSLRMRRNTSPAPPVLRPRGAGY